MLGPRLPDRCPGLLIGNRSGKQFAAQLCHVRCAVNLAGLIHLAAINRHEPGEIARMADVHGVGEAVARGINLFVPASREKIGEFVVAINRHNQPPHRQAHLAGEHRAHHVAEIAGGNRDDQRFTELGGRVEIVNSLRQQPPDVDRVGG